MGAKSICDGCGLEAPMIAGPDGRWRKPDHWYERSDNDGIQTACHRDCIEKVAATTDKTAGVLPV